MRPYFAPLLVIPGDAPNPWGYLAFRSWLKYFTCCRLPGLFRHNQIALRAGRPETDFVQGAPDGLQAPIWMEYRAASLGNPNT